MRKVFIVEDDRFITAIFTMFLRDLGHELVGKTSSGKEAIEMCKELKPDVVMMDIHLEGDLDGIQTAEMLKREIDVPIIYISSDTTSHVIERAIVSNSYGYLVKPINKKELGISIDLAYYKHKVDLEQKEREKGYREFISDSPLPIIVVRDGKVMYLNRLGMDVFKTHYIEDVMGLPIDNFVHEKSKEEFANVMKASISSDKRIKPFMAKMKTVHGDLYWAEITGSKVNFNGKLSVQLIIKDISDEKLNQKRVSGLEESLFNNERICVILNKEYKILRSNAYTKKEFGVEDLVGMDFNNFLTDENIELDRIGIVSDEYQNKVIPVSLKNSGRIDFNVKVIKSIYGDVQEIILSEKCSCCR